MSYKVYLERDQGARNCPDYFPHVGALMMEVDSWFSDAEIRNRHSLPGPMSGETGEIWASPDRHKAAPENRVFVGRFRTSMDPLLCEKCGKHGFTRHLRFWDRETAGDINTLDLCPPCLTTMGIEHVRAKKLHRFFQVKANA